MGENPINCLNWELLLQAIDVLFKEFQELWVKFIIPQPLDCCCCTLHSFYSNCHTSLEHFNVCPSSVNDLLILTPCILVSVHSTFLLKLNPQHFCLLFHNKSNICINFSASMDEEWFDPENKTTTLDFLQDGKENVKWEYWCQRLRGVQGNRPWLPDGVFSPRHKVCLEWRHGCQSTHHHLSMLQCSSC